MGMIGTFNGYITKTGIKPSKFDNDLYEFSIIPLGVKIDLDGTEPHPTVFLNVRFRTSVKTGENKNLTSFIVSEKMIELMENSNFFNLTVDVYKIKKSIDGKSITVHATLLNCNPASVNKPESNVNKDSSSVDMKDLNW